MWAGSAWIYLGCLSARAPLQSLDSEAASVLDVVFLGRGCWASDSHLCVVSGRKSRSVLCYAARMYACTRVVKSELGFAGDVRRVLNVPRCMLLLGFEELEAIRMTFTLFVDTIGSRLDSMGGRQVNAQLLAMGIQERLLERRAEQLRH